MSKSALATFAVAVATVLAGLIFGMPPAHAATPLAVTLTSPTAGTEVAGPAVSLTMHVAAPAGTTSWSFTAEYQTAEHILGHASSAGCADVTSCDVTLTVSTIGLPNGAVGLTLLTFVDGGSMLVASGGTITVDNPVPTVSNLHFVSPEVGGTVSGQVTVAADAVEPPNDLGATLKGVIFTSQQTAKTEVDSAPYTDTVSLPIIENQPYAADFTAQAVDSLGNRGPVVYLSAGVEKPPTFSVNVGAVAPSHLVALPASLDVTVSVPPGMVSGAWNSPEFESATLDGHSIPVDASIQDGVLVPPPAVEIRRSPACACTTASQAAQASFGFNLPTGLTGWHQLTLRADDAVGGYVDFNDQVFIDQSGVTSLSLTGVHAGQKIAAGSTVNLSARAATDSPSWVRELGISASTNSGTGPRAVHISPDPTTDGFTAFPTAAKPHPLSLSAAGTWHVALSQNPGSYDIEAQVETASEAYGYADVPVEIVPAPTFTLPSPKILAVGATSTVNLALGGGDGAYTASATSSNSSVATAALSGAGAERTLTVRWIKTGKATITVHVTSAGGTTTKTMSVTVNPKAAETGRDSDGDGLPDWIDPNPNTKNLWAKAANGDYLIRQTDPPGGKAIYFTGFKSPNGKTVDRNATGKKGTYVFSFQVLYKSNTPAPAGTVRLINSATHAVIKSGIRPDGSGRVRAKINPANNAKLGKVPFRVQYIPDTFPGYYAGRLSANAWAYTITR